MENKKNIVVLPKVAKIIPTWSLSELSDRACSLCEAKNKSIFIRSDMLPVAFCPTCSLWYISEIPSERVINDYYKNYFENVRPTKFDNDLARTIKRNTNKMMNIANTTNVDPRVLRLKTICGNKLSDKRILEIGCGNGQFLHFLSASGANVIGCELSYDACNFINNRLGIRVLYGSLEENIEQIGKVDVVVMNDVIEHLIYPQKTLQQINSLLSINGLLLIWTPNGSEAGTTLETAIKWDGFKVDLEHLQYFSSNTIRKLANQFNYDIIHLESLGFISFDKLTNNNSPALRDFLKKARYEFSSFMSQFALYRAIVSFFKEFINTQNDRLGTYVLFSILRKS